MKRSYLFHVFILLFLLFIPGITAMFSQADSTLPNVYDPQQLNRYAFARDNPYKYIDKDGRAISPVHKFGTFFNYVLAGFSIRESWTIASAAEKPDIGAARDYIGDSATDALAAIEGYKPDKENNFYHTAGVPGEPYSLEELKKYYEKAVKEGNLEEIGYAEHAFYDRYYHTATKEMGADKNMFGKFFVHFVGVDVMAYQVDTKSMLNEQFMRASITRSTELQGKYYDWQTGTWKDTEKPDSKSEKTD